MRSSTYWLNKWRRRAARLTAQGLTTRGTPRRQEVRPTRSDISGHGIERKRQRERLRYRVRFAPHLLPTAVEAAWAEFRRQIPPALTWSDILDRGDEVNTGLAWRRKET